MPLISARTAVKLYDVSKPTLQRALSDGRISAMRAEDGKGWLIDTSELQRVFKPRPAPAPGTTPAVERGSAPGADALAEPVAPRTDLVPVVSPQDKRIAELERERDELAVRLEVERATLTMERDHALVLAAERDRALEDMRRMLNAIAPLLIAGPTASEPPAPEPARPPKGIRAKPAAAPLAAPAPGPLQARRAAILGGRRGH